MASGRRYPCRKRRSMLGHRDCRERLVKPTTAVMSCVGVLCLQGRVGPVHRVNRVNRFCPSRDAYGVSRTLGHSTIATSADFPLAITLNALAACRGGQADGQPSWLRSWLDERGRCSGRAGAVEEIEYGRGQSANHCGARCLRAAGAGGGDTRHTAQVGAAFCATPRVCRVHLRIIVWVARGSTSS